MDFELMPSAMMFKTMKLPDWYLRLHTVIQRYSPSDPTAPKIISKFYTQLIDYLVNPKNLKKNSQCIYSAFIDDNTFERLCSKHQGLFKILQKDIKMLKQERYPITVVKKSAHE